jgi:hypothetical protein
MLFPWNHRAVPITMIKTVDVLGFSSSLDAALYEVHEEMRVCGSYHSIFVTYRRYRRGKNRCKYCGCKVKL